MIDNIVDKYLNEESTAKLVSQHTEHFGWRKMKPDFDGESKALIKQAFSYYSSGRFTFKGYEHIQGADDIDLKKLTAKAYGIIDKKTGKTIGYIADTGTRYELRSNLIKWQGR